MVSEETRRTGKLALVLASSPSSFVARLCRPRSEHTYWVGAVMTRSGFSSGQSADPRGGRLSAARGLERLALIPFKAPTVTVLAALVIAALAIVGIEKIRVDNSLSQMFRSNDVAFKQYEEVT